MFVGRRRKDSATCMWGVAKGFCYMYAESCIIEDFVTCMWGEDERGFGYMFVGRCKRILLHICGGVREDSVTCMWGDVL